MAPGSELKGCLHCYAAALHTRNLRGLVAITGTPLAKRLPTGIRWTGEVGLIEKSLHLPLKWRRGRKIFVNSLSDLWHRGLSMRDKAKVYAVMALCQAQGIGHTFLVLTKRPEERRDIFTTHQVLFWDLVEQEFEAICGEYGWCPPDMPDFPLKNVHEGTSIEDQETANRRIPELLLTPAWTRFVSYEPALGPVNFRRIEYTPPGSCGGPCFINSLTGRSVTIGGSQMIPKLDQVIFGGESGSGARPCNMGWARATADDCAEEKVAFFMKQAGAKPFSAEDRITHKGYDNSFGPAPQGFSRYLNDKKGGDMPEWPKWAQVRQFPEQNV